MNGSDIHQATDLGGQVAIVTGGGRGIGRAIALGLAKAGAAVAVVARSADQLAETVSLIERMGGCAIAFPADVTNQHAIEDALVQVKQKLGAVDLLINNAGVIRPAGPVWEVDPDIWWRCIDVNLRGQFLCARAILPAMIARRQGRIINVSSAAGLQAIPYGSAYAISKAAVIRFTENLAAETKEYGISVFVIYPGEVRTTMTEYLIESDEGQRWAPWVRQIFEAGHDVQPERAAELVVFLASGRGDALSGRFISVRDDITEMVSRVEEIQRDDLYTLRLRT